MARERGRTPDPAVLQQIFRDSPLPIAIYDLDGELQHSNDAHDAFADALGDAAGIGEFNALRDLRSERGGHRAPFQRAAAGEALDYAFAVRPTHDAPDEETLHFHRLLLPAYDDQRSATKVVSIVVEVSDWLRAQHERARLHAELQQAQKIEGLGLLAGSIAHDFNNLLVGVLGNVSLLLEGLDPGSSLHRFAQAVELAARRAADLARQLLAYAGKGQIRVEELNLSELAREISELLRITIAQRAELQLELPANLAAVKADATQMRQVLMNLVTNARDAVGANGHITLRTGQLPTNRVDFASCLGKPDAQATSFVYFEVEDDGQGMDAETVARIFDPFFTTKPSGRGLGLSAVLGIVRNHGGALHVQSAPGRGTRMRVLLPAHGETPSPLKLISTPAPASEPSQHRHVLVVDDQEMVRALLGDMLKRLGYTVTRAGSAREALDALDHEADATSCVLLDLTMPDQDGSETFADIRARFPRLPVVFMSGYDARSGPAGDGFLPKPFTMSQLRQVLSDVLDKQTAG